MIGQIGSRIRGIILFARENFWQYRKEVFLFVILGLLGGLLDGIGIGMLIPLFSFVVEGSGSSGNTISRILEQVFSLIRLPFTLPVVLAAIIVVTILSAVVSLILGYLKVKISYDYENKMRQYLYRRTLRARWSYLLKQKIGYLESVLMGDVKVSTSLLMRLAELVTLFSGLAMYIMVAMFISPKITLTAMATGILALLFSKPLITRIRRNAEVLNLLGKDIAHRINEGVIGLKTIKAAGAEEHLAAEGFHLFDRFKNLRLHQSFLSLFSSVFTQPLSVLFVVVLFALFYKTPGFNLGAFAAVVYLVQRIFMSIGKFQGSLYSLYAEFPIVQILNHYREDVEREQEERQGSRPFRFEKELSFRDVHFSYENNKQVILDGISFRIARGETVGIVGSSGAGKTTLVDLLLRLFEPKRGSILLDGAEIGEIDLAEWRSRVGYVSQDIFLRNDTLMNNIRFFYPGIGPAEAETAAKNAQIYDFVRSLPHGFDTKVGERGVRLSGGQRQRIALARVLARRPEILILDEATSAVDSESETAIQESIKKLKGDVTILIITHRIPMVLNSDRIIVLDGGKIVESGNPSELLSNKETHFFRLYQASTPNSNV